MRGITSLSLRHFIALTLIAYAAYHVYDSWLGYAVYEYDGACLKHKKGSVEFPEGNYFSTRGSPLFKVQLQNSSSDDHSSSLSVRFDKFQEPVRERLASRLTPQDLACPTKPYRFGLVEQSKDGNESCPITSSHRSFVPDTTADPFATVRISCAENPKVLKCSLRNYMNNGWVAQVNFPKRELSHWKDVALIAENFFKDKLIDCGERS
ncbi:hypothetical protein [uncultured Roseibium sp.]|uniref:hypothetical protein n=1 Tax=uncultured Roseibium sp. TaxID=1936171 RepID=UPI00261DCE2F|nr:hypothetical protein [uncultured Roseibium sp.]